MQSDVNIYAQWTKNADVQAEQITVEFVDNFNETKSSTEVKKGEAVAKPADPTYDGWTFEGWSSTLKDDEGNWLYTPVDFTKQSRMKTRTRGDLLRLLLREPGCCG